MTDPHTDTPATPAEINPELVAAYETIKDKIVPSTRTDGWIGPRQRRFLEAVADGDTVRDACRLVGLSPASAYAFRRTARGRAFDLGWKAADLLARERVAADLLIRSVEGQAVEITRADGSTVTKHHYDNRLAVQMLNRLDRYADASERTAPGHAARLVAGDFDGYLQLVGEEGGPARAGLYMLARGADGEGTAAELEPVVALARADRLLRCGTVANVAVADLDPARRADWTAEQWARAETAGIVALAPSPAPEPPAREPASTRQPCSTSESPHPEINARDLAAMDKLRRLGLPIDGQVEPEPDPLLDSPVWWDDNELEWRTRFPAPAGFDGYESEEWDHPDYERTLTDEEEEVAMRRLKTAFGLRTFQEAEAERDLWFREAAGDGEVFDESAGPAGGSDPLPGPNPSGVEGAGDESASEADAASPSADSGSAAPQRPNPSDVEGEAALALVGAREARREDAGTTAAGLTGGSVAPERTSPFNADDEAALAVADASRPDASGAEAAPGHADAAALPEPASSNGRDGTHPIPSPRTCSRTHGAANRTA